jgi:hypothetical protein
VDRGKIFTKKATPYAPFILLIDSEAYIEISGESRHLKPGKAIQLQRLH